MRFIVKPVVLLLTLASILTLIRSAGAESAGSLFNKGRDAEARQDYEAAYDAYRAAYEKKPTDLKYRISYERLRFLAAASLIHRGQLLRDSGRLQEALALFQQAAQIDPSSAMADQEIQRTTLMLEPGAAPDASAPLPPVSPMKMRAEQAAGPVELAPISEQPITLRISEDSKIVYQTIGKLAGVNVLFDPDYTSRRIPLELNGVTLNEALDIVALESKTFWRPVTPNTIFVAADTPSKRKEIEQSVVKTFYLGNLAATTDLQDISNALRTVLDVPKIQQVPSQGAIVIRATPDQVALAEKIIGDLDKPRSEVIVEVAVMQVRRDKMRNLGITPPASVSASIIPSTATSSTTTTGTTTTTNPTLNILKNLTDRDISVVVSQATANFLYTDANTKLIQNPQIRASDGAKATLKIGDRIPIATGSFGGVPGAGLPGAGFGVQTQFTYVDVGVNVDITPRVHANREVSLKVSLEVSSVTKNATIGGIEQPIIGQRKIEHEIRLKEGEVSLLGGIFEQAESRAISGIPGLAKIPILRYFFSSENKDKAENEIVFALTPHIVRGPDLTELNLRAVDVGTSGSIDLRRVNPKPAARPPNPPLAPSQPSAPAQVPVSPPTAAYTPPVLPSMTPVQAVPAPGVLVSPPPAAPSAEQPAVNVLPPPGGVAFRFDSPVLTPTLGSTFSVSVLLVGGQDVYSVPLQISYDPATLELLNISNGDLLSRDGQPVALVHREDPPGTIQATSSRPPGTGGVQGDGPVFVLTYRAKARGNSRISISRPGARNRAMEALPATGSDMRVKIQ